MNLALVEIRRSKLRFGLLSAAVALLVFLVLLLTTLSSALVNSLTGALKGLDADVVVYSAAARDNLQASRLQPGSVRQVAAVEGVAAASGVYLTTTSAQLPDSSTDLQLIGMTAGTAGAPTGLVEGQLPTRPGQIAMDGGGVSIGDRIELTAANRTVEVVGLLRGSQFNASPTGYVVAAEYGGVVRAVNPGVPFVPVNAVAVTVKPGAEPAAVAAAVTDQVPGAQGYELAAAVDLIPGVSSISQSFGILVGLTFIIGIVVIGFFFLILTVQKMRSFTLLRAIGASRARLGGVVAVQITVVVLAASALACALTAVALIGLNTGIPVSLSPALVAEVVGAVLLFSLLAGWLSIRRIAKIDPFTAAGAR